jgi:hypothetical protein
VSIEFYKKMQIFYKNMVIGLFGSIPAGGVEKRLDKNLPVGTKKDV